MTVPHHIESTKEIPRGWYKFKRVRGGAWVPVMVYIPQEDGTVNPGYAGPPDRNRYSTALIDGEREVDPRPLGPSLMRITREEYETLAAANLWARENAPASAEANTSQAVNLADESPLF